MLRPGVFLRRRSARSSREIRCRSEMVYKTMPAQSRMDTSYTSLGRVLCLHERLTRSRKCCRRVLSLRSSTSCEIRMTVGCVASSFKQANLLYATSPAEVNDVEDMCFESGRAQDCRTEVEAHLRPRSPLHAWASSIWDGPHGHKRYLLGASSITFA